MTKALFTSDTHFGQQRTLELSRRPFPSVEAMDAAIISNWNTVVGPDDVVFHLGDFGDPSVISKLRAKKIWLLPGNYDTPDVVEELIDLDDRVGILVAHPFPLSSPDDFEELPRKVYLIHEPETADDVSKFYLYGHIHQLQMVKRNGLNVGVDCHQFYPIDWETVSFYYTAIKDHYDRNVFMPMLGAL